MTSSGLPGRSEMSDWPPWSACSPADHPGWRVLQVEADCAGQRAELVADVGDVEAQSLLG